MGRGIAQRECKMMKACVKVALVCPSKHELRAPSGSNPKSSSGVGLPSAAM